MAPPRDGWRSNEHADLALHRRANLDIGRGHDGPICSSTNTVIDYDTVPSASLAAAMAVAQAYTCQT